MCWVLKRLDFFLRTRYVEQWSEKMKSAIKICQDFVKSCQETFLVYLDKLLRRSYQDLPWNFGISRSWQDFSSFARSVKMTHILSRSTKFQFSGLDLQNFTSLIRWGSTKLDVFLRFRKYFLRVPSNNAKPLPKKSFNCLIQDTVKNRVYFTTSKQRMKQLRPFLIFPTNEVSSKPIVSQYNIQNKFHVPIARNKVFLFFLEIVWHQIRKCILFGVCLGCIEI